MDATMTRRRSVDGYTTPLTEAGQATVERLVSDELWGGAIAYRSNPCIVIYGVPAWVMPNGKVRVGEPDAPMMDAPEAVAELKRRRDERDEHDAAPELTHLERFGTTDAGYEEQILDAQVAAQEPDDTRGG